MQVEDFDSPNSAAQRAASLIASAARAAVLERGRFVMAVSGGKTPWLMMQALAGEDLPWDQVHLVQVDERIAPAGNPDRNLTQLRASLLNRVPLPDNHIHAMPVESADLEAAARSYASTLEEIAGSPAVMDLVHLGLGPDGHTASLVPNDPVLNVTNADVALTGDYQGRRRMTLTYPIINRARRILWLVTGDDKATAMAKLLAAEPSIPAGRVRQDHGIVVAAR